MDNRDTQQDIKIAELETNMCWVKDKVNTIEAHVTNHLPHKIDILEDKIAENKLSTNKWLLGIMVSIVMLLIATIVNLCLK